VILQSLDHGNAHKLGALCKGNFNGGLVATISFKQIRNAMLAGMIFEGGNILWPNTTADI
jgi:hypothetical protein